MQQSNRRKNLIKTDHTFCLWSAWLFIFRARQRSHSNSKQIKQQESKIAEQNAHKLNQASLKDQESKINSVVGELRETELSLKEIRKQMAETEKQIKQLESKSVCKSEARKASRCHLSFRCKSFYLGKNAFRRCQKAERMKVYYQHLNQVRIDMINNLKATQENLAKQREAISGQQKIIAINFLRKETAARITKSATRTPIYAK